MEISDFFILSPVYCLLYSIFHLSFLTVCGFHCVSAFPVDGNYRTGTPNIFSVFVINSLRHLSRHIPLTSSGQATADTISAHPLTVHRLLFTNT